ncbi:hypothetical protein WMW72_11085 [Paenibacillus filicis]|uniref:Uncharacterized protein n=1 Tax=Paenibacillus filicis TaxID=669464 RepID=A0ABU9DHW0_9BACL
MSQEEGKARNSANFKENKFVQEENPVHAGKAAKRPASLNGVSKENNPQ